jgi:hypothetical protein
MKKILLTASLLSSCAFAAEEPQTAVMIKPIVMRNEFNIGGALASGFLHTVLGGGVQWCLYRRIPKGLTACIGGMAVATSLGVQIFDKFNKVFIVEPHGELVFKTNSSSMTKFGIAAVFGLAYSIFAACLQFWLEGTIYKGLTAYIGAWRQ